MSRTPLEADPEDEDYHLGWSAVTRLLRQGWSWSGHERGVAFRGLGPGPQGLPRFATVSHVTGLDQDDDGRAVARLDWDRDGDLDLVQSARSGPRLRLLQNTAPPGRRLAFLLVGDPGQRDAIGARLAVDVDGPAGPRVLTRTRRAGEGFLAQSSAWLSVGFAGQELRGVRVRWPDGAEESFEGVAGPGRWILERGSGRARADGREALPPRSPAALEPPAASQVRSLVLHEPLPMPGLPVTLEGGRDAVLFGLQAGRRSRGAGRPMLVNLWASWCAPCRGELAELTAAAPELREAGLLVLALAPDEEGEREASSAVLDELGWPHARGLLSGEAADRIDVLQGALQDREVRLPVPTSLLIDGEGRLDSLHFGPLDLEALRRGLARISGERPRAADALPAGGRWRTPPTGFPLEALEAQYRRRGMGAAAEEVSRATLELQVLGRVETLLEVAGARARQGNWEAAVELYREAGELDPDSFLAWQGLAVGLHQQGRAREARDAYREALRLDPSSVLLRFNLALVALDLGDPDLARHQLGILERSPDERAPGLAAALRQRLAEVRSASEDGDG